MLTARRPTFGTFAAVLVAVLVFASGLAALTVAHAAPGSTASPSSGAPATEVRPVAPVAPAAPAPAASPPHGNLVVVAGHPYYINSTEGAPVYYQAGNITVESGGILYLENVTLSFVQFIGSAGTAAVRLSHIDHFLVDAGGTVKAFNSTVTTDLLQINAYAKLNVTIQGTMDLWKSTFAFPGWVYVHGAGATLTLNRSTITRNPAVIGVTEPTVLQGDEDFAAQVVDAAGGTVNLFNSTVAATYANNLSFNGTPRPVYLELTNNVSLNGSLLKNVTLTPGHNETLLNAQTRSDPASLARDWLYPSGITGGEIAIYYNNTGIWNTTATVYVTYNGHPYDLGVATLVKATIGGVAILPFPAGLTSLINTGGLLSYLNYTGSFGVTPAKISADITGIANVPDHAVVVNGVFFALNPPVSYDVSVTGAGSHFNTVDTSMDLTFLPAAANPLSMHSPIPWYANQLKLSNGANASLGNLSVPNALPGVFYASAITADATSHAFLFRWAQVNLTGLGGVLPVYKGKISAYYAYNSSQSNNATTKWANNLQASNPAIWKYLQYWDQLHQLPAYATSGYGGKVSMLLLSNELTSASLPDGLFMGVYHLIAVIPVAAGNTHAFNGSVSPYPSGVAFGSPGYRLPDFAHAQNFPSYFAGVDVKTLTLLDNGTAITNSTFRIGDPLEFLAVIRDTGTAPVFALLPSLLWNQTGGQLLASANLSVDLVAPGATRTVGFNWTVSEAVTGDHGTFNQTLALAIVWNYDLLKFGGGRFVDPIATTIHPSLITFSGVTTLPALSTINVNTHYATTGAVHFAGSGLATLTIFAKAGGNSVAVGAASVANGSFVIAWLHDLSTRLVPGTTYTLVLYGTYNAQGHNLTLGTYLVPFPPVPSKNFLTEKVLGLPLWIWLAIGGAIAAGLIAFFLLARRQAAGKVVECGECGALVPESASACPKCGAEFESDLVRCSRCASTIPANSQFCPECAAQLLGKPGEGGRDPERDGYADFTERFRAEGKKELGENYTEGSFWDWWKRQPTYTPFSQWKLQQQQGAPRGGMMAPPAQTAERPDATPPPRAPPRGGTPPAASASPGDRPMARRPPTDPGAGAPPPATGAAPAAAGAPAGGLKPCPNCRKEIPPEYLVCPFCGSVTQ